MLMPLIMPESEELYLEAEARDNRITDDNIEAAKGLPVYVTNFIGSKQKLTDWIWLNTPDDVKSVLDAFSGSAVLGKSKAKNSWSLKKLEISQKYFTGDYGKI